jgi:cytoskeletal protein RodZ
MRILFAISILSFLALIWAAVAITRRIRASHKLQSASKPAQPDFSQYLFAAAEDTSNSLPTTPEHTSSHDLSSNKSRPANQSHANSYDKIISTERG